MVENRAELTLNLGQDVWVHNNPIHSVVVRQNIVDQPAVWMLAVATVGHSIDFDRLSCQCYFVQVMAVVGFVVEAVSFVAQTDPWLVVAAVGALFVPD